MCPEQVELFWSALEAIGTTLAAILALFFWLYAEHIKPDLESPKLLMEFGNAPPFFESLTQLPPSAPIGHWLDKSSTIRLRLHNLKRHKRTKAAYNIRVRVIGLYDKHFAPVHGFSPITLAWSETNNPGYLPLLNPSDYEYVNLLRFEWIEPVHLYLASNPEIKLTKGKHYITLVASAENSKPYTQTLEITLDETRVSAGSDVARAIYRRGIPLGNETQLFYCEIKPAPQISNPSTSI